MQSDNDFSVNLLGFKTIEQAIAFVRWYEGGGEQAFYDYCNIVGRPTVEGWTVDVRYPGNAESYFDIIDNAVIARIKGKSQ